MTMKKITLIADCSPIPFPIQGDIGLLVETTPDGALGEKYKNAIPIIKLIGDLESHIRLACALSQKLLEGEPCIRGVPQLSVYMENMSMEFEVIFQLLHLYDFLVREGYRVCEFITYSWWGEGLQKLLSIMDSPLQIHMPILKKQSKLDRCLKRMISAKFSLKIIYTEFKRSLDQIDLFHRRSIWLNKFKRNKVEKNKVWFYTTAETFTNIGLLYEPSFPESLCYLVENPLTGGAPLKRAKRTFVSLYDFAQLAFIPSSAEIKKVSQIISQHFLSVPLDGKENIARTMLVNSQFWTTFFSRLLPYDLFTSSLFDHWIDSVKPAGLVVGNQVFEAIALYKARSKNVPTILLQHGVCAPYYKYMDFPVDHYVVRGRFFYDRLSEDAQCRALIFNPKLSSIVPEKSVLKKKAVVFVTMSMILSNRSPPVVFNLNEIILAVLQVAVATSLPVIFRVHPLERVIDYQVSIDRLFAEHPDLKCEVSYSQGDGLEEVLEQAAVAVMFESTVFLECIKYKFPIIGFGWYNSTFAEQLFFYKALYRAKNIVDFSRLLMKGIGHELVPMYDENIFLANNPGKEFCAKLEQILYSQDCKN